MLISIPKMLYLVKVPIIVIVNNIAGNICGRVCRLSTKSYVELNDAKFTTIWMWYWNNGGISEWEPYGIVCYFERLIRSQNSYLILVCHTG